MGIKDFFGVLKSECPDVLHPLKISALQGISVAIDISVFFNMFVKSKSENWLNPFVNFLIDLKKHKIAATFIFDGLDVPPEKNPEQQRRREEVNKRNAKLERGKELLPTIAKCKDLKKLPSDEVLEEIKKIIGPMRAKNMETDFDDIFSIYPSLVTALGKMENQSAPILPEYTPIARDFIESMGFDFYQAKGEAEALCAAMCIEGRVDAVISEDSDVMAYGCPYLLCKWKDGGCMAISVEEVLTGLDLPYPSFRDMCIFLGCDYNKRDSEGNHVSIMGYPPSGKNKKAVSIGTKKVLEMIQAHRTLEGCEAFLENSEFLKYERCRELFTPPDTSFLPSPTYRNVDFARLKKLWSKHRISQSYDKAMQHWKAPEIVLEADVEMDL